MSILNNPEFWVAIGFAIVLAILAWKGAPAMITKMLDKRSAVIAAELEEARRLSTEALSVLEDYQSRARGAEVEAQLLMERAKIEAERLSEEARQALKLQIEQRLNAAKERIAQAEAKALKEVQAMAADAAISAAEKLIRARMDEERTGLLIANSIKDLANKLN
jgi:F-type H+-transporting ATPase subunit b